MAAGYHHHHSSYDYDSQDSDTSNVYVVPPPQHLPKGFEIMLNKNRLVDQKDVGTKNGDAESSQDTETECASYLPAALTCFHSDDSTDASLLHSPPSLLKLCVHFVATNIHLVDSLVDFPEVVGKSLFSAVITSGGLDKPTTSAAEILSLFSDAYAGAVLEELSFGGVHQIIMPNLELWQGFTYLKKLDVADCKLGDDHELLSVIGHMTSLTQLNLTDNALTNQGIQRLTSPLRVLHTGPSGLQHLNLACNPQLGNACIRYLLHWTQLETLNLSGTAVTADGLQHLESKTRLIQQEDFSHSPPPATNKGWAANVVNKWLKDVTKKPSAVQRLAQQTREKSGIGRFYSQLRIRSDLVSKVPDCSRPPAHPQLFLCVVTNKKRCRSGTECSTRNNVEESISKKQRFSLNKGPSQPLNSGNTGNSQGHRDNSSSLEGDLLAGYLCASKPSEKLIDFQSLWGAMNSNNW